MTSSDAEPVRVTKRGHRFIKDAKDSWNRVGTIQGFADLAVTENVRYFQKRLRGTDDIRDFCSQLSDVNGIELELPEYSPNARLVKENLDRRVLVDLDSTKEECLTEIRDCTGLGRSKIIRLCLLKQLYRIANETDLYEYPKNETIEDAWLPAKKAIDSTFPRMVYELHLQVVKQKEFLRSRIERDQHSGDRLQGYYENHFYHTAGYDRVMEDELGAETLDCLESVLATAVG
jgi:hypothetical protein